MNEEYIYDIGKYTIGVDTNGEDGIGLTVAMVENNEIKFLGNCYGDNARCIDLLIRENQQLKSQLEQRDNIISASINKYIKEYEQKIDFEIDMGSQGEYKKIKCYEEFINKLNDLKNILEKSDK